MITWDRVGQAAAAVTGIAALIIGLVLAAGRSGPQSVVAVVAASNATSDQIKADVAAAEQHAAGMLVLETDKWQEASIDLEVISGLKAPLDVSVEVSPSGVAGVARELPAAARVIDANGSVLRSGSAPSGPGLLALAWAVLLILFALLAARVALRLRKEPWWPWPALVDDPPDSPPDPPQPPQPPQPLPSAGGTILARFLPQSPAVRWEPQCPRCGTFTEFAEPTGASPAGGYECLACGQRWAQADPAHWPDVIVSYRRRAGK